jgi:hypothetical protein
MLRSDLGKDRKQKAHAITFRMSQCQRVLGPEKNMLLPPNQKGHNEPSKHEHETNSNFTTGEGGSTGTGDIG